MPYILLVLAALWWFEVWPFAAGDPLDFQTEYIPEVGYYRDDAIVWWTGERFKDKTKCLDSARVNSRGLTNSTPTRVTSIACRVMRGERFLDRAK